VAVRQYLREILPSGETYLEWKKMEETKFCRSKALGNTGVLPSSESLRKAKGNYIWCEAPYRK